MAPAVLAAAALSAALFASRLPPGPDFLLPRRAGWWLFTSAWSVLSSPVSRRVFSVLVLLALLVAVAELGRRLWRAAKPRRPRDARAWPGLAVGPLLALALAWRLWGRLLDLTQLVWFPYASLDAREPFAVFALAALVFAAASASALAWLEGRRRRATLLLLSLVAGDVAGTAAAYAYGVGERYHVEHAGSTVYVALTTGPEGPAHESYVLSPGAFGTDPRAAHHAELARPRSARTLPALRALYQAETMRWDEEGLRRALLLGASLGDGLARSLLLSHLESARPSPAAKAALGALADEDVYRVGGVAAARFARAYARLGEPERAAYWAAKASIPAGLLGLEDGGALRPGRVAGTVKGPAPLHVALYRRGDAAAPYLLDASGFVAKAAADARGRFAFEGLAAGRYFLAFAFPAPRGGLEGGVSVRGHRGDVLLDARRPSVALPTVVLGARED